MGTNSVKPSSTKFHAKYPQRTRKELWKTCKNERSPRNSVRHFATVQTTSAATNRKLQNRVAAVCGGVRAAWRIRINKITCIQTTRMDVSTGGFMLFLHFINNEPQNCTKPFVAIQLGGRGHTNGPATWGLMTMGRTTVRRRDRSTDRRTEDDDWPDDGRNGQTMIYSFKYHCIPFIIM